MALVEDPSLDAVDANTEVEDHNEHKRPYSIVRKQLIILGTFTPPPYVYPILIHRTLFRMFPLQRTSSMDIHISLHLLHGAILL